ncbi:hypothetical protein BX600DRAFT_227691 [Xylariales sp. PMI_506]|nr:hypothetical protein BX600DRAFT_227691 [Xylariales sp. PMI_506]
MCRLVPSSSGHNSLDSDPTLTTNSSYDSVMQLGQFQYLTFIDKAMDCLEVEARPEVGDLPTSDTMGRETTATRPDTTISLDTASGTMGRKTIAIRPDTATSLDTASDTNLQSTPESSSDSPPLTNVCLSQIIRRIGTASVRIELVSVLMEHSVHEEHDDSEDELIESADGKAQDINEEDEATTEITNQHQGTGLSEESAGQSSQGCSQPRKAVTKGKGIGAEGRDDDNDEGHEARRKRPRPGNNKQIRKRFACPYQAFEPMQDCVKRSATNPEGGCAGINR